jgi:hypothetical protein
VHRGCTAVCQYEVTCMGGCQGCTLMSSAADGEWGESLGNVFESRASPHEKVLNHWQPRHSEGGREGVDMRRCNLEIFEKSTVGTSPQK